MEKMLSFKSQRVQNWYKMYHLAYYHRNLTLYCKYKHPSPAKLLAWNNIKSAASAKGADDVYIIGSNCMSFTAAFVYEEDGKKYFQVETKDSTYISEVQDD